jgi:hypothetical protein
MDRFAPCHLSNPALSSHLSHISPRCLQNVIQVVLETGSVARQANGAVLVKEGDSVRPLPIHTPHAAAASALP